MYQKTAIYGRFLQFFDFSRARNAQKWHFSNFVQTSQFATEMTPEKRQLTEIGRF
jgi:hypothetical protein